MAHQRQRLLEEALQKSFHSFPIVGLVGARQTGKTTLLKKFCTTYKSFDDPGLSAEVARDKTLFLSQQEKPLFLDEVQKYPDIFDYLKIAVDEKRRPGQFLITGSVRFADRKNIRESLTGRIQTWTLLPLTVSECFEKRFSDWLTTALSSKNISLKKIMQSLEKKAWCTNSQIATYLQKGGLPGTCFLRDPSQANLALEAYLDTILSRDLHLVLKSSLRMEQHLKLLTSLVENTGLPVNYSTLARLIQSSVPTIKTTLNAYEALFLIQRHGANYFVNDPALARHFFDYSDNKLSQLQYWAFMELRAQTTYRKELALSLEEYKTRGGSHVPFILKSRQKSMKTLAFCLDDGENLSEKSIKSLYSFKKKNPNSLLFSITCGEKPYLHKEEILAFPWNWLV